MRETRKVLRIVRIRRDETLTDMARKLNITASMLSAIECGKRNTQALDAFIDKVIDAYSLEGEEKMALRVAAVRDQGGVTIRIPVSDLGDETVAQLVRFSDHAVDLTSEEINRILIGDKLSEEDKR